MIGEARKSRREVRVTEMARGAAIYRRRGLGLGLGGVSGPSDRDRALRTERGTRWLLVGCVECLELRRERNRATRW